ncbi:MAG: cation transporter [Clostridia bacterium]|nr:cation transporter [Clostridia bacterium]
MNASTAVILVILLAVLIVGVKSYMKKLASGCCGSSDAVKKVRPQDTDSGHYPYHKSVSVEGMMCENCARRVENAFNARPGMMAKASAQKKCAEVWSKEPLDDEMIRRAISEAGYSAVSIR